MNFHEPNHEVDGDVGHPAVAVRPATCDTEATHFFDEQWDFFLKRKIIILLLLKFIFYCPSVFFYFTYSSTYMFETKPGNKLT